VDVPSIGGHGPAVRANTPFNIEVIPVDVLAEPEAGEALLIKRLDD
jgi:hypothetical protein